MLSLDRQVRKERELLKDVADVRAADGTSMPRSRESKSTAIADRDAAGSPDVTSPARQRSTVVFPDPEAPNRIVMPGGAESATSSANCGEKPLAESRAVTLMRAATPTTAFAAARRRRRARRTRRPAAASAVRLASRYCRSACTLVVDRDRDRARDAGQVAADHEHDAELAEGVREAQDERRPCTPSIDSGSTMRDERAQARGAERGRGFEQRRVDLRERGGDRLHGERQAVEDRRDDQRLEREGEAVSGPRHPRAADRTARADRDAARRSRAPSAAARAAARRSTSTRNFQRRRENVSQYAIGRPTSEQDGRRRSPPA